MSVEIKMQCTGHRDINGCMVFEGDILRSDSYPFSFGRFVDSYLALVCYDRQTDTFELYVMKAPDSQVIGQLTGTIIPMEGFHKYQFEKVGNINDNVIVE